MVESRNIHEMGGDKTSSSLSLTSWMAKNLRFLPLLKSTWIPTWHPMDHVSQGGTPLYILHTSAIMTY